MDQYAYIYKYMKQNMKTICVRFHMERDSDIIERLSKEKNMSGYIKRLIREDIEKEGDEK